MKSILLGMTLGHAIYLTVGMYGDYVAIVERDRAIEIRDKIKAQKILYQFKAENCKAGFHCKVMGIKD